MKNILLRPTFELLPFFPHIPTPPSALNPFVSQESSDRKSASAPNPLQSPKPLILPKPASRKIGVKIDIMRSATILTQVVEERNKEYSPVINYEDFDVKPVNNVGSLDVPASNKSQFLEER